MFKTLSALSAAVVLNITVVDNLLKAKGFIVKEGYNPDRDAYERVYDLGFTLVTHDVHKFYKKGDRVATLKARDIGRSARAEKPMFKVHRQGCSMEFKSLEDMRANLWKMSKQDGYNADPNCVFFVENRATGYFSSMPSDWIAKAVARRQTMSFETRLAA